jgi:hypothetical protein
VKAAFNEKTAAASAGRFIHPDALAAFLERPQAVDQIGALEKDTGFGIV